MYIGAQSQGEQYFSNVTFNNDSNPTVIVPFTTTVVCTAGTPSIYGVLISVISLMVTSMR
jgi:hypothetical protein